MRLLQSRTREAIPWREKTRATIPTFPLACSFLGAAYALDDETERGVKELEETYRLSGKTWVIDDRRHESHRLLGPTENP